MEKSIKIVEQKGVTFYDDELIAVRASVGQIYVSIRHLCEAIGVTRQGQVRRIREHHVLSTGYAGGNMMLPPSSKGVTGVNEHAFFMLTSFACNCLG